MTTRKIIGLRPCTFVWVTMMGLTLATYIIGEAGVTGLPIALTVLGFALVKGQMVGDYFMGLKRLRGFWRWPVSLWLFIPGGLITAAFTLAS